MFAVGVLLVLLLPCGCFPGVSDLHAVCCSKTELSGFIGNSWMERIGRL